MINLVALEPMSIPAYFLIGMRIRLILPLRGHFIFTKIIKQMEQAINYEI